MCLEQVLQSADNMFHKILILIGLLLCLISPEDDGTRSRNSTKAVKQILVSRDRKEVQYHRECQGVIKG